MKETEQCDSNKDLPVENIFFSPLYFLFKTNIEVAFLFQLDVIQSKPINTKTYSRNYNLFGFETENLFSCFLRSF